MAKQPRDCIALALDNCHDLNQIRRLINEVRDYVGVFKIGLEQFTRFGPSIVGVAREAGGRIFLDLKFHDIPNTVAQAVKSAATLGVDLLTIHTQGGVEMMKAASQAARQSGQNRPKVIGVTVLTSISESALRDELAVGTPLSAHVEHLAQLAARSELDGIVCSAADLLSVRSSLPKGFEVITPGIRLPEGDANDQKRIATPADAIKNGATILVVGRPINEAKSPAEAAERFCSEVASVLGER